MYEFRLPDVGEGIHEAELVEWLVDVGATIAEGDPIATVNTDKVSVELPSPRAGVVSSLPWTPGDVLHVGDVLMVLDGDGDGNGDVDRDAPFGTPVDATGVESAPAAAPVHGAALPPPSSGPAALLGRPVAAPSTRKLAAELGVELDGLAGSGPAGRILRSDVEAAVGGSPSAAPDRSAAGADDVARERLTGARGAMFRHMSESSATLATTTSTFTVRMERVEGLVAELRRGDAGVDRSHIGVLAVSAACLVRALTANPRFNATADPANDDLCLHSGVHLGVAVASPTGLLVPVLRDADAMRLDEIGAGIVRLADAARQGSLGTADLRGGTFTVSSTGGLERSRVTSTQPIVNLPQVALLWMSRIRDEPVVDDGVVRAGRIMSCSLSFDHRYLDGAEATAFINDLTELIEHPVQVLL